MINFIQSYPKNSAWQRLPYIAIIVLFVLQFGYIMSMGMDALPDYFGLIVAIILGVLIFQVIQNTQLLWFIILTFFSLLICYLLLAFFSDLLSAETMDGRYFKFLGLGIILFSVLIGIEILLIRAKP